MNSLSVVKLNIRNFMSISDMVLEPKKVTQICGKNNQGKSTILKAISFVVSGDKDPSLVKIGEEQAEVALELSDGTVIKRKLKNGKQTVSVKKDNFTMTSPQAYLDQLFDKRLFNPLTILDPKTRNDAILQAIDIKIDDKRLSEILGVKVDELPPLDYNQHGLKLLDQAYKYYYARRAEANRETQARKQKWEAYNDSVEELKEPALSEEELHKHQEAIEREKNYQQQQILKIESIEKENNYVASIVKQLKDELRGTETKIENLLEQIEFLKERKVEISGRIKTNEDKIQEVGPKQRYLDSIQKLNESSMELQIIKKDIDHFKSLKAQRQMIDDLESSYKESQAFSESLDKLVNRLGNKTKDELIKASELPVEGLSFEDGEFKVQGASLDHLSSAEALKLSLNICRKLSGNSKLICIDGAELLDEDNFQLLKEQTKDDGFTYFITKVGEPFKSDDGDEIVKMEKGKRN